MFIKIYLSSMFSSESVCVSRYPDFKSSVANHFTFCLKCKMNCAQTLNNFRGEILENLVPTFYHYLQFGYYNGKCRFSIHSLATHEWYKGKVCVRVNRIGKNKSNIF